MYGGGFNRYRAAPQLDRSTSGDLEACYSGGAGQYSSYLPLRRTGSFRSMAAPPRFGPPAPPAPGIFPDDLSDDEEGRHRHRQRHFLDSCFLCKKALSPNRDIFMYKGNVPFCSEECRQEQIETDEAEEKVAAFKHRSLAFGHRELQHQQRRSRAAKSPGIHVRAAAG